MSNQSPLEDARHIWFLVAILILLCLTLVVQIVAAVGSYAEELPDCRSIKAVLVPPQAVVHQPDGDTVHIFTFDVPSVVKIRIVDAETPERGQPGFDEAKAFTRDWLARGPFRVVTCGVPTFDRVAGVVSRGDETLAGALKAAGHWREKH